MKKVNTKYEYNRSQSIELFMGVEKEGGHKSDDPPSLAIVKMVVRVCEVKWQKVKGGEDICHGAESEGQR